MPLPLEIYLSQNLYLTQFLFQLLPKSLHSSTFLRAKHQQLSDRDERSRPARCPKDANGVAADGGELQRVGFVVDAVVDARVSGCRCQG